MKQESTLNNKTKRRKIKEEKATIPTRFDEENIISIKLSQINTNLYDSIHKAIIKVKESKIQHQNKISQEEFINSIKSSISLDIKTPSFTDKVLQKQLLKSLYNGDEDLVVLPIVNNEIRADLFGVFSHFITDNLLEILRQESITEEFNIELLNGISGSGKTFKLHAKSIYHDYYLLYMICTPPILTKCHGDGLDFSHCEDFSEVTDHGYQLLLKRIGKYSNFITRHVYVDCECQMFLMSRLLYLLMLIKQHSNEDDGTDLTPSLFLQYQLNGNLSNIKLIYVELIKLFEPSDYTFEYLLRINSILLNEIYFVSGRKVGFALDEINSLDQSLLKLNFLSKISNKFCSFTFNFLSNIVLLGQYNDKMVYLGISGTNYDMISCERYLSSKLYKDSRLNIYYGKVDSIASKEDINSFFSKFFNVNDSNYQEVINSPYMVNLMIGRKRILSSIITKLGINRDFKDSVLYVYKGMCQSLMDNMKIKRITITNTFLLGICNLVLRSFLSKRVSSLEVTTTEYSIDKLDWIPTGLCNVENSRDSKKKYLVTIADEMFVNETLLKYIKANRTVFIQQFMSFMSNTPELFQSQPFNSIFELLILLNIITIQTFTLNDFTNGLIIEDFNDEKNVLFLPSDIIEISQLGTCGEFGFVRLQDYLKEGIDLATSIKLNQDMDHSYWISRICGKLVKAADNFHPDYFSFQYCKRLKRLFILEFSLKCSEQNEFISKDDFVKSIFKLRTDMYFGSDYSTPSGYQPNAKYQDLLDDLMKIPSVKIHIIFPGFTDFEEVSGVEISKRNNSSTNGIWLELISLIVLIMSVVM